MPAFSTPSRTDPYSLMRLAEAWRNWRGLRTLAVTFVLVAVVLALGGALRASVVLALTSVIAFVLLLLGCTTAGMQFMQQAAGKPVVRGADVLQSSPGVLLRSMGLAAIVLAFMVVLILLASLLLALCRIPGVGEVLFIVVLPLLTFVGAVACVVLPVIVLLAAPALWEGHSLRAALVHLWGVVTQRPLEAFVQLLILAAAATAVAFVLFLVVAFGMGATLGLAAVVLARSGADGGPSVWDGVEAMSSAGSLYAGDMFWPGSIGAGIVTGGVVALIMAVINLGLSLVYLNLQRVVDLAAAEVSFDVALSLGKRRPPPPPAPMPTQAPQTASDDATMVLARQFLLKCPACQKPVVPSDLFCTNCGNRLV